MSGGCGSGGMPEVSLEIRYGGLETGASRASQAHSCAACALCPLRKRRKEVSKFLSGNCRATFARNLRLIDGRSFISLGSQRGNLRGFSSVAGIANSADLAKNCAVIGNSRIELGASSVFVGCIPILTNSSHSTMNRRRIGADFRLS